MYTEIISRDYMQLVANCCTSFYNLKSNNMSMVGKEEIDVGAWGNIVLKELLPTSFNFVPLLLYIRSSEAPI